MLQRREATRRGEMIVVYQLDPKHSARTMTRWGIAGASTSSLQTAASRILIYQMRRQARAAFASKSTQSLDSHVPHPSSPAAMWFDWSVLPGYDEWQRVMAVRRALDIAEREATDAVLEATGEELKGIIDGVIPGLLRCLGVVGVTTFVGAAAGALLGGVGAGPGAAAGFEAGMFILTWAGIGFLAGYIVGKLGLAASLAVDAASLAWNSVELAPEDRRQQEERAGKMFARALGEVMRALLQGIVAFLMTQGRGSRCTTRCRAMYKAKRHQTRRRIRRLGRSTLASIGEEPEAGTGACRQAAK
jgi:hypothetical protein